MQWLLDNWIIALLAGGMIGMHLFGHGKHGGHGGHGGGHRRDKRKPGNTEPADDVSNTARPHSHDDKDAAPRVSSDRATAMPDQVTEDPKTTDVTD